MADMALGYGSEYQLLRALGHHRNEFFRIIKQAIGLPDNPPIEWLDYPTDGFDIKMMENNGNRYGGRISEDGEWCDIQGFKGESFYDKLDQGWDEFWPVRGQRAQNWDGIFRCSDKWFLVEAKAHKAELKSSRHQPPKASDTKERRDSWDCRKRSFQSCINDLVHADSTGEEWMLSTYYQMANRLAMVWFLRERGIEAYLVNIFFLNGYIRKAFGPEDSSPYPVIENKSISCKKDWESAIKYQHKSLGLDDEKLKGISYDVFVDCRWPKHQ